MARRGSKSSFFNNLLFLLVLIFGFFYLFKSMHDFNPDKINNNSVLKDKTFEADVVEISSPKGIKAYLLKDETNPIIAMNFMFKNAGYAHDANGLFGIANMTASLLKDGAGKYSALEYKEKLEELAISLSFSVDADDFKGALLTTRANKSQAAEMLKLALVSPSFDKKDIERVKTEMLTALKTQVERPAGVLKLEFKKELFKDHSYARNPIGEAKDIEKISQKDLKNFVQNSFVKDNLVAGLAGDISEQEAGELLDSIFGDIPVTGKNEPLARAEVVYDGRVKHIDKDIAQNIASFGAKGALRLEVDFYPLYVTNYIFGGAGLNSRLSLNVRENEGLTYSIYTYLDTSETAPMILGGFSSTPENMQKAFDIFKVQWNEMQKGVKSKELKEAKDFLTASYNLRFASTPNIAEMLTYMQKESLGIDFLRKRNSYIEAVSLEDVNRVAELYFGDNGNLVFVTIGKQEK